jgi:hypothetical protein
MTRAMKAHVSTMLTESGLSIALRARRFKDLCASDHGRKTTSTIACCVFRLGVSRKSAQARRHREHDMGPDAT